MLFGWVRSLLPQVSRYLLLLAEKENSVKNLCFLAANISLEQRLQELTLRKDLELESHRQLIMVINLILATAATSMAQDHTGPAVLSEPVIAMERGSCQLDKSWSSISSCPGLCPGEDTPASPHSVKATRKGAVTSYKHHAREQELAKVRDQFVNWEPGMSAP